MLLSRPVLNSNNFLDTQEELVAEIGAVMLTGNNVSNNTKSYIQHWITKANKDISSHRIEIYKAFQLAHKATLYIITQD